MMRKIIPIFVVVVWSALSATVPIHSAAAAGAETCIGDWAKASVIVQQRKMIDVAGLSKLAREKYAGKIMSARLCQENGKYFYRLVIRGDRGNVQRVKVDVTKSDK